MKCLDKSPGLEKARSSWVMSKLGTIEDANLPSNARARGDSLASLKRSSSQVYEQGGSLAKKKRELQMT